MMRHLISICLLCAVAVPSLRAAVDFSHDIVPLLREHCAECHAGDKKKGGLSMNTRESLLEGSENGKVVEPGKAAASKLMEVVQSTDREVQMPPKGPRLGAEKIAKLREWIDGGLKWEEGFAFKKPAYDPPLELQPVVLPPAVDGRNHPVDRILDNWLAEKKRPRPAASDDAGFLRRVSLDLIGLLPTPEALEAFLADPDPEKRQKTVAKLLADDTAYAEHWLSFWNDLLRNDYSGTGYIDGGRKQITGWLYRALIDNKPYDQFVRELIAPNDESAGYARGIKWRGSVSAGQTVPVQFAQSIGQSFLGINLKCASCHDSFIDRWKLSDAYGLAAVYSPEPLELHRCDIPTGKKAQPAWLFPELGTIDATRPPEQRLQQLAALMTHPKNGRFTRTITNRLWHRLMGRGIVHPVDAMQTEPWHPVLLDFLASHLQENKYDLKKTVAFICASQAYQSKTETVAAGQDDHGYLYGGPRAKRLTAEQFVDAVWQVCGNAPAKIDAGVLRGRNAGKSAPVAPVASKWIWAAEVAPPAGETITFRREIDLPAAPKTAGAAISADNSFVLYVNGRKTGEGNNWEQPEAVSLTGALKTGRNELLVVATNGGAGPNPAGLNFQLRIVPVSGAPVVVASDAGWQWTREKPNAKGKFSKPPQDWKPAVVLAGQGTWARAADGMNSALAQALAPQAMVRASLLQSDLLMRSLGRPNREQIVSMRPADLSTLEAMDLNNGQILASRLEDGARKLMQRDWADTAAFANWLYAFALSRPPTDGELALAKEALGEKPTATGMQDLLWAVFMLPEFQLVR